MAKARAIIKRLKAVRNVRKITRTMELVATARFKKAMDRATEAAAYTKKMAEIVADLAGTLQSAAEKGGFTHPLLQARETEQRGILLVLTSNRGLCGGYNGGIIRLAMQRIREAASRRRGTRRRSLRQARDQLLPVPEAADGDNLHSFRRQADV